MLFTSWDFALFIAVLVPVYYLVPKRLQQPVLLLANVVFYAFAGLFAFILLFATGLSVYLFAIGIGKTWSTQETVLLEHKGEWDKAKRKVFRESMEKKRRILTAVCLILHFGILAAMKYGSGLIGITNTLFGTGFSGTGLVLTMGASFYTFSAMGYVIDVQRGKYPAEKNPLKVLLYTSFFPILVQGPISRFDRLGDTLFKPNTFQWDQLEAGLIRVLWGYAKKLLVADRLLVAVKQLIRYPDTYNGAFVLVGMLLYAATLYADFTGGIDITIGIGKMLGITIDENFSRPYFSKSIAEYWRRWHMTLGAWFKEYVYYPVSVSKLLRRLTKAARRLGDGFARRIPVYIATMAVWAVTGMWHGNSWNFLVWGLMNGAILLISEELTPFYKKFHTRFPNLSRNWFYRAFTVIRTVLLMSSLRMFDCYATVPETFQSFGSMFTIWNLPLLWRGGIASLGLSAADYAVAGAGIIIMFVVSLVQRKGALTPRLLSKKLSVRLLIYGILLAGILVFGYYGFGFDAGQFIYNRF